MSEHELMAAFAKRHGVSKACVSKWKARGLVVLTPEGLVDVTASEARLAARPVVYRGGAVKKLAKSTTAPKFSTMYSDDPATWTTSDAIRRKEIAQARLRQIEADTAAGLVVPITNIADAVRNEYAIVRTALLGMPSKLAARLAAATTPQEAGALVDVEVRSILEALTQDAVNHGHPAA